MIPRRPTQKLGEKSSADAFLEGENLLCPGGNTTPAKEGRIISNSEERRRVGGKDIKRKSQSGGFLSFGELIEMGS